MKGARIKVCVGEKFGRLLVTAVAPCRRKVAYFECLCDCGKIKIVRGHCLSRLLTRSCGCLAKELTRDRSFIHGQCESSSYNVWVNMIRRCDDKHNPSYRHYGGRGISVCDRWRTFKNFFDDMGERPEDRSIDRINNDGNYEPTNCRWATIHEQLKNRRPFSRKKPTAKDVTKQA